MTKSTTMLSRIITAMLLIGVIFGLPRQAASQSGTVVKLPVTYFAQTCQETPIAVRVENVTGLTAYHLEIDFEPGDIEVTGIQNGNFLPTGLEEPGGGYDNTAGTIQYGMARRDYTTPPVDGSGVLMYIWVRGVNPGANVNFTIRPYVPGSEPTNGTGSALVGWPDAMPIPYTIVNGTVVTQSCPSTEIQISNDLIDENLPIGSPVGTFSTIDPETETGFVYTLVDTVSYPDNALFTIVGDVLYTNAIFNYEIDTSYTIQVRSDKGLSYIQDTFTITVTDVNDRPVLGSIGNKTVNEHQLLTFTATATDEDLLPAPDTLTFSLAAGSAGAVPAGALIGSSSGVFTWTPAENQGPGVHTFDVCVSDGFVSDCETIQVTVNEVNAPPSSADKTVTILEDGSHTFLTADFAFDDSDDIPANQLLGVKIGTLPLDGVLKLGESLVAAGDTISAVDLAAGNFKYFPDPNENDFPYASFQFQVQDNGGTVYGGVDLDPTIHYFTINVTSVNDAPAGANKTITITEDGEYVFTTPDFGFSDPNDDPDDGFVSVKIATLPSAGTLIFNNVPVTSNQVILISELAGKVLKFTPAANGNGSPYASFTFQVQDDGGTASGGVALDPTPNTIAINVTAVNDPPVGVNDHYYVNNTMDIDTNGTPLTKEAARLVVAVPGVMSNDSDVDGDTLTVNWFSYTGPGTVTLESNGSFTYQSQDNVKEYTDSFVYTLSDGQGGTSGVVTVNLTIDREPPPGDINWLEPITGKDGGYLAYDDPLTLKFSTTSLDDVVKIQFRWWNTTVVPLAWVIVYDQPPVPGKLEYSYTLDMKTLPYRPDVQVYAYVFDSAGSYSRIRIIIDHNARVFLPLIMKN